MKIFAPELARQWLGSIRLIATDMDGTLTHHGQFDAKLLLRLQHLQERSIPVIIVTGRSAGWVSGLVEYLPVVGAIAENGGLAISRHYPEGLPLVDIGDRKTHRHRLHHMYQLLQTQIPQLQVSADNAFRITDWTFENVGLFPGDLQILEKICLDQGWGFTYSSLQCHIKLQEQSKRTGLLRSLPAIVSGTINPTEILTIGDSPNDADLLDHETFPYSVGVANIQPFLSQMQMRPQWITREPELSGFLAITEDLIKPNPI